MTVSVKNLLMRSAYRIVRALATVLLRHGVSYAMFSETARAAFIDAATEFEIEGRKLSDSRISVVTGLSRKEVKRLKDITEQDISEDDGKHNRAVRVITAWNREKKYLTQHGKPRVLPIFGGSPSLHELVTEYGGGVPTRAVVDELSRVGAIEKTKTGRWRLENPAYVPKSSEAAAINILGTDVPLLLQTINHNLGVSVSDKRFQRKVMYEGLSHSATTGFRKYSADESFKLLKKLDKWLAAAVKEKNKTSVNDGLVYRIGVSAFYFEEQQDSGNDHEK